MPRIGSNTRLCRLPWAILVYVSRQPAGPAWAIVDISIFLVATALQEAERPKGMEQYTRMHTGALQSRLYFYLVAGRITHLFARSLAGNADMEPGTPGKNAQGVLKTDFDCCTVSTMHFQHEMSHSGPGRRTHRHDWAVSLKINFEN